ncbi:MAG TPA: efflux RND transporter periplasmic adaptor subunit [Stellaceae bacterium]|nr:efflux RND transporter periplasmic adaptor subunit [Stellaceae bacterium]
MSSVEPDVAMPRGGDAKVAVLEQVLWRQLTDVAEFPAFLGAWLALLCRRTAGTERGVVVMARDGSFAPAAMWPEAGGSAAATDPSATLAAAVENALVSRRGTVRLEPSVVATAPRRAAIATPIILDDMLCGAVGVELQGADEGRLREIMRQLQWGAGWVRERLRQRDADNERRLGTRGRIALDIVAAVSEDPESGMAARRAVTTLATKFGCTRVSLGWLRRGAIRIAAISHSAYVDRRMTVIRRLAASMEEAIDQQSPLLFPAVEGQEFALHAHQELAGAEGGTVLTVPVLQHDHFVGALLFERPADQPFDQETVLALDAISAVLAAVLVEKHRNDRWLIVKAGDAVANQLRRLLGPAHFGRKVAMIVLLLLVAAAVSVTDEYDVTADARLEGTIQRAIVVSLDGYLHEAPARAGDIVHQGDVLASLDDRDLVFERLRWVAERQQRVQDYERAMGTRDRAATKIAQAQIEQTEAQIHLVDTQLERMRLVAPFDGIVVSGDHSQSIGASVKRGDVLFEIAPLDHYRLKLEVDESRLADLKIGQHGRLITTALPYDAFPFTVTRITPVTDVVDGRTVFRVDGELAENSPALRPGMKGLAKISVDRRRVVWIWTRSLIDYLRLFAWNWFA